MHTRWVPTWKVIDGETTAEARLVIKGTQDPDLQQGLVETAVRVSLHPSHLQFLSLHAVKKRAGWSLEVKNASLQADRSRRDVFVHAPPEWGPRCRTRTWQLRVPAYGLHDAPVAFYATLQKYLPDKERNIKVAGLNFRDSSRDPRLYYVVGGTRNPAGASTTHIDDILGRGGAGIMEEVRVSLTHRFGAKGIQETNFTSAGAEISQKKDFSVAITQKRPGMDSNYSRRLLNYGNIDKGLSGLSGIHDCRWKLGEPRWLATASRPDMCARLAVFAAKVHQL